jgi:hypothetical protein
MTYSHRNGETEPPTKPGWYWVKGTESYSVWDALQMRYVDRKYQGARMAYRMDSIGQESIEDIGGKLQWWGPVVPPWELE